MSDDFDPEQVPKMKTFPWWFWVIAAVVEVGLIWLVAVLQYH